MQGDMAMHIVHRQHQGGGLALIVFVAQGGELGRCGGGKAAQTLDKGGSNAAALGELVPVVGRQGRCHGSTALSTAARRPCRWSRSSARSSSRTAHQSRSALGQIGK